MSPLSTAEADREVLRGLTVLYVEDDGATREQMSHFLRRRVGTLLLAADGLEGLERCRTAHPDLVVTDLQMPGLDGLALAQELARLEPQVPVVLTTAFEQSDYFLRAIELGIARYILKPVDLGKLELALLDCAHRISVERQLAVVSERLERVVDASFDGYWEGDLGTGQAFHSARFNELIGLPARESTVAMAELTARVHPADRLAQEAEYAAVLRGEQERFDVDFRVRHPDGSWRWLRSRGKIATRRADGSASSLCGVLTDIDRQKQIEHELRSSEQRFRTLADSAPVGVFEADVAGHGVYLNQAGFEALGLERTTLQGMSWLSRVVPEDLARVLPRLAEANRAGQPLWGEVRVQPLQGGSLRLVRGQAAPIRDAQGELRGFIGVLMDVTDQRALQEERAINARLSAMATLVGGVAHETNNPLSALMGTQSWVQGELEALAAELRGAGPFDRARATGRVTGVLEAMSDATASSERIARIVRNLALMGRPDPVRQRVKLSDVVRQALRLVPPSVLGDCTVRVDDRGASDVLGSKGQLWQVVVNLVTNAVQSIPAGREGVVSISLGDAGAGLVQLDVADNGAGISAEVQACMFDPFFTTQGVGRGMGLGLPVAYSIVRTHGGTLTCTSVAGAGSTFRVELPRAPGP